MKKVTIVLRKEHADRVVHALIRADVPRFHVSHVQVFGAGVDPEDARFSMEEGARYTEKTRIELFCRASDVDRIVTAVCEHATTGCRGDGVLTVTTLDRIVGLRTGEEDLLAVV